MTHKQWDDVDKSADHNALNLLFQHCSTEIYTL